MADLEKFLRRVDSEVASARQQALGVMQDAEQAYESRQRGFELFLKVLERVRELTRPRLEALAERFKFDTKPIQSEHQRGIELAFRTEMAAVSLKFTATHDTEVRNLLVEYQLRVVPIFIKFAPQAQFESSLAAFDENAFAAWLDDRLVEFVKTYLEIHTNSYYQKDHLATDPVANIQFPKIYAQVTLDEAGRKLYFISEKTRDEYLQQAGKP